MLNKEKYAKEIVELAVNNETIALIDNKPISCMKIKCDDCERHTNLGCFNHILTKWANSEYKEPILDEVEKEYLSNVIKPWREKTISIIKVRVNEDDFISIRLKNGEKVNLPWFKKSTMYKGMEANKVYTLEELGL